MALGKKNKVKVALENYTHLIMGERKVGKTTLLANIAKEVYGNVDDLLLISIGDEDGYHALDGINYENPMEWTEFVKIVDELVNNPNENEFKIIGIDTIDELVALAEKEVLRLHKKEKGSICKSLNDALGGFGNGRKRLISLLEEQLTRLRRTKYGIFLIGHNKVKEIKQKLEGDPYSVVTSNLNADYFNVFAYKADIVCNIVAEKIVKDKVLQDTARYMYYRNDGFVDAGSRFPNMPVHVEYGAMNYFKAVEEGIKASLNKDVNDKEFEKLKTESLKEKETVAKEYAQKYQEIDIDKNQELIERIKVNVANIDVTKMKSIMKEYGFENFSEPSAIKTEALVKIAELIK